MLGRKFLDNLGITEKITGQSTTVQPVVKPIVDPTSWKAFIAEMRKAENDPVNIDIYLREHGLENVAGLKDYLVNTNFNDLSRNKINNMIMQQKYTNIASSASGFKGVSAAIQEYNNLVRNGSRYQTTFLGALESTNPKLATYLKGLNNVDGTMRGYAASLVASTAKTFALQAATMALNMAMGTIISIGISAVISRITTAYDNWVHRIDNAKEALEQSVDAWKDSHEKVKELTSQLKECQERLAELQKLSNSGKITVTQKGELERLKETNKQLKIKLALQQADEIKNQKNVISKNKSLLNQSVESRYEKVVVPDTFGHHLPKNIRNGGKGVSLVHEFENALNEYNKIKNQKNNKDISSKEFSKEYENIQKDIDKYVEPINTSIEAYENLVNAGVKLNKQDKEQYNSLRKLQEQYLLFVYDINQTTEAYDALSTSQKKQVALEKLQKQGLTSKQAQSVVGRMSSSDLKKFNKDTPKFKAPKQSDYKTAEEYGKAYYEAMVKGWNEASNSTQVKKSSFDSAWSSLKDSEQKKFTNLVNSGKLTAESFNKLGDSAETLKQTGLSVESLCDKIRDLVSLEQKLRNMSTAFKKVGTAYKDFKKNGFVSSSSLNSMSDAFKNLKGYSQFSKIAGNKKSSKSDIQNAFNDITSEYLNTYHVLSGLTDKTKDKIITALRDAGITNANDLIKQYEKVHNTNTKLLNASEKNYIKYLNSKGTNNEITNKKISQMNAELINALGKQYKTDYNNWLKLIQDKIKAYNAFVSAYNKASSAGQTAYEGGKSENNKAPVSDNKGVKSGVNAILKNPQAAVEADNIKKSKQNYDKKKKQADKAKKKLQLKLDKINADYTAKYSPTSASGSGTGSGSKSKDKTKATAQIFDFIERRINKLTKIIDYAKSKMEALFSVGAKNNQLDKAIKNTTNLVNAQRKAAEKYQAYANKLAGIATKTTKKTVKVSSGVGDKIVKSAKKYVRKLKYVWGGTSLTSGADCSGFVQQIFKKYGINLPRTSKEQWANTSGKKITNKKDLKKGDLVFFGDGGKASNIHHVGVYAGNGKFVESPYTGKKVRVSKLSSRNDFVGGVRANKVANATTTKQIKVKGLKKSEVNKYIKLIKNGSLTKDAIKSIKNEKLKTFIENYQTYYDKAQEAKKAVQENITSIVELNKQKLDNITSHYDTLISKIEATTSKLEAQLSVQKAVNSLYNNGETGSASTYKNLLTSSSSEINKYIAEKKAYDKERKSARKQLNNSLKKSGVSKSQRKSALADFDATTKAQIDNFNTSIFNAESKLYEYAQSLASLPWDKATAKIEKLSITYDILQAKLSNGTSVNGKNKILDQMNDNLDSQLSQKKSALKKDKQNVKSSALWINKNSKIKVTAGKLLTKDQLSAIKGIYGKDSKQYKEAVKYNSYVKALQNNQADYDKSVEENKTNKAENFKTQFTNIQTGFERSISDIEAKSDHIENAISILEAKGYKANASYYEKLAQISGETITKNTDELTALKNKLQEGLDNGTIKVGTDSYYEMVDAISSVEKNIDAATLSQEQFLQKVRETNAELKEHARTAISDLNDEAEFYQDILSYKDAYDDNGNMTDAGKSRLGLSLTKMSNDIALNNKYNEAIAELDASYAKHDIGYDDYYTKRKELVSQQRESIKNYYSEVDAIKSLIEEGYNAQKDALSDLISKYTDALDAAKNLHDYEKSIKEKTENIDSIKKRIAALQGNDTEEARQKLQKLQIDLKKAQEDLDETQYEEYINDQKDILSEMQDDYEKFVEEQLKDVDDLIRKLIEGAKGNTQDVLKVLESLANKWDIDLSAILKNDMEKGDFSSVDNKDSNAVDNANKHYDEDKKNEEYNPPAPDDNKSNNEEDSKNPETKKTLTDILKEIADENANETTHQIHGVEGKDQNGNMWYNRLSTDKINQLVYDKTGNVIEDSALMDLAKKLGVEIPKGLTKEMLYSSLDKQPKLAQEFRDALFEKLQDMDFSTDIETLLSGFTTPTGESKPAGESKTYAEQAKAEAERQSKENETKYLKKILNNLTGSANDTNKPLRKIKPGETSKSALNKKLSADYGVVVKSGTGNHGQKYIDMFAKAIGLIGGDGYGENDEVYQKLKKEYPHLGFSTGGVVGELNKVATDNGDDGWITVKTKERVLTARQNNLWEKWTKNLPELVNIADYLPSMSEYMPKIPDMAANMQVQNGGNSVNIGDISYTMEFPNVTDSASMKEAIKHDTSLQDMLCDITIGQMKKGNKLGMMKY